MQMLGLFRQSQELQLHGGAEGDAVEGLELGQQDGLIVDEYAVGASEIPHNHL